MKATLLMLLTVGLLPYSDPLTPQHNVSIEMQVVALPRAAALPMIRELQDPAKINQAYERIQELLIAGTAKLVGWPNLISQSAQRATMECVNEFRYATSFEGNGTDTSITADGRDLLKQDAKIKGGQLNAVPSAFETRNLGVTLDVEPILSPDRQMISVSITARNVWRKEMRLATIERDPGERLTVEQPDFGANSVTTSFTLKNGQRILLGSFATSEHPDHMELFLLKVEAKM